MRCHYSLLCAIGAAVLLTAGMIPPAAAQSFPLICRGGGSLAIQNVSNTVQITFQRSGGPISAGLSPGQCTWVDRAVSSGEPNRACDNNASRAAGYVGGLVLPSNHITLQVANNGQGCLVVSRAGF